MTQVSTSAQIASILTSVALVGLVIWLIRRGRVREETALYWLLATGVLLLFSLRRDLLGWTASLLGIYYPPTVLLLGIVLAGTLLAIHFSVSLTRLDSQNKRLAQELALLSQRIDNAEPTRDSNMAKRTDPEHHPEFQGQADFAPPGERDVHGLNLTISKKTS